MRARATSDNNATIIGCGRSASVRVCPWHHMTVRGRGTVAVENQNGASSPGHF